MIHPRSVAKLLAMITVFMAYIMMIPALIAFCHGETDDGLAFIITIALMLAFGLAVIIFTRNDRIVISLRDSYLFVTLTWVLLTFFAALPMYFAGISDRFALCYFEMMSGFTTTGATALTGLDGMGRGILFWRNMTNWLGGMGVVVLFVAVLPSLGAGGTALFGAESVGPTKDKLKPKIRDTASILWLIYCGLSALQTVLLMAGGLDWFEAMTLMFGTMGAAGYAAHDASVAFYGSAYVEWVCIIFMFIAGTNFSLYYFLIKRKFWKVRNDGEYRLYWRIVLIATALISISIYAKGLYCLSDAIRHAAFQVVSIVTTTGFVSTDYNAWPVFAQAVLYMLFYVGGCAGSTGGGIKVVRVGVMGRLFVSSLSDRIHPHRISAIRLGDQVFDTRTQRSIAGFFGFYILNVIIGTLVLSLTGEDLMMVHTSVLLTLGNVGIGLNGIGTAHTFAVYPDWALWCFSFLMMVGRLELFTVYALFTRTFWRR